MTRDAKSTPGAQSLNHGVGELRTTAVLCLYVHTCRMTAWQASRLAMRCTSRLPKTASRVNEERKREARVWGRAAETRH